MHERETIPSSSLEVYLNLESLRHDLRGKAVRMTDEVLFELTPMATLGLALCLAYLKLDRFRYRQTFQEEAQKVLKKFQLRQEGIEESLGDTAYFLGLKLLANWSDSREVRKIKKLIKERVKNGSPFGWRIVLYRILFEPPLPRSTWSDPKDRLLGCPGFDRLVVTSLAVISLIFLVFGRAHLMNILSWDVLAYMFDDHSLLRWWLILLICLLFPIIFAPIGDFVLRGIKRNIEHIDAEVEKFLSEKTSSASALPL